ncbi:hypothetical protein [Anaerosacchariphilus polymeriproducens]|uniref:Uncharacterized protein n=1 Tax=Anaerosacchariphilus polymeriproducens TaxID=1812858 RepID=A0A371ARZ2_9FIRM|nr:hypothetical protein [Anaerosacchariphilus polymeriproducens]RDU22345.1 hypothetical protein DWV06_13690 [Anaerosacchariphilus polymeriproducens]
MWKRIINWIRYIVLIIFIFFLIPTSATVLDFVIRPTFVTVDNVLQEAKELLYKQYPLLEQLPENTVFDKYVHTTYDNHDANLVISIYITVPKESKDEVIALFSDENQIGQENKLYVNIDEKSELSKNTVHIILGGTIYGESFAYEYAKNHQSGSSKTFLIWLLYFGGVILIIIALVFPYGKLRKKHL